LKEFGHVYIELLDTQRTLLNELNQRSEVNEELIRKYVALVDLEEYKVREKLPDRSTPDVG